MRTFFILFLSLSLASTSAAQLSDWKSGIELGTGLSFTGYNVNLAYLATFGQNVVFAGPKIVYSDANSFYDSPGGLHAGYRRMFEISPKFSSFASLDYQLVFFKYNILNANVLNSIHEFHFSYGVQYFFNENWSIGNSLGGGGYLERLVDPFDQQVNIFSGYSAHIRIFGGYHF